VAKQYYLSMTSNLEGLAHPPEPSHGTKRALVVAAHPDDADFGAAGTACLWSRDGWEFYYLVCTDGSKGSDDPSMTPAQLIEMRRQEQRDAAKLLGVKDCYFLDHVDGELTPNRALLGDIVKHIRMLKPDAVFTHDPEAVIVRDAFVNHSDHRTTGLTAVDAVYPAARDRLNFPEHIQAGLEPHKVSQIYIWGSERANFDVDITDAIDTKIEALRAHGSQFSEEFLATAKQRWRREEDGRYVESYRRVLMAF
jgi:LmbE family N-acetylglucosaminyl deacetylase